MKRGFFFLCFLILSGCVVSQEDFYSLQREVALLKKDFRDNAALFSTEAGEIRSSTKRLDELHGSLRKSFADTNARIEEIEASVSKLKGEKEDLEKQIRSLTQSISEALRLQNEALRTLKADYRNLNDELLALKSSEKAIFTNISTLYALSKRQPVVMKNESSLSEKDKSKLYNEAMSLYNNANFDAAIEKFSSFVNIFPYDNLTPNALYWIGECYYTAKKYEQALEYFHRVVTDFPNSNKVAAALLKEAFTLRELGMVKEAQAAIEELNYRFPYSKEAKEGKKFKERKEK